MRATPHLRRILLLGVLTVALVGLTPVVAHAYFLSDFDVSPPVLAHPGDPITVTYTLGQICVPTAYPFEVEIWLGPPLASPSAVFKSPFETAHGPITFGYTCLTPYHSPGGIFSPGWSQRYQCFQKDLDVDGDGASDMVKLYHDFPNVSLPPGFGPYTFTFSPAAFGLEGGWVYVLVGYPLECENWTHYSGSFSGPSDGWECPPPKISDDLEAQKDSACLTATVKVHPALQVCVDKRDVGYMCLNPATNPKTTFDFAVLVKSNLPFYKQFSIKPFAWTDPQPLPLMSYKPSIDPQTGKWVFGIEPVPGGAGPDVIPASYQSVEVAEVDPDTGAVGPYLPKADGDWVGPLGDADHHQFIELVRWNVMVDWCVTAGYYTGQFCVDVYQN